MQVAAAAPCSLEDRAKHAAGTSPGGLRLKGGNNTHSSCANGQHSSPSLKPCQGLSLAEKHELGCNANLCSPGDSSLQNHERYATGSGKLKDGTGGTGSVTATWPVFRSTCFLTTPSSEDGRLVMVVAAG